MTELHLPGNNSPQLIPPIFLFFLTISMCTISVKHCDNYSFTVFHGVWVYINAKSLLKLIN